MFELCRLPLHYAAAAGASDEALKLLKAAVSPNWDTEVRTVESYFGMTPAQLAIKNGHSDTAKFIDPSASNEPAAEK